MRAILLVLLVVFVVGMAGGAGWYLLSGPGHEEAATDAADAFVAAWSRADWAALDETTTTTGAADAHARTHVELDASDVDVTLTDLDVERVDEGIAPARYEANYELEGAGEWTYTGAFEVVDTGDEWRVDWQPSVLHPEYEDGLSFQRTRVWPDRAPITGPGGEDLAGEGDVVVVGIEPQRVEDDDAVIDAIEELTPATGADAEAVLGRGDLRDDWFYPVVTMARPAYDDVRDELRPVPGLVFQEETDRTGASEATDELIGRVDEITAEQLEELGAPYQEGDIVGRTGLEASLERRLAGDPGGTVELVDGDGEEVATVHEFAPSQPDPVELTLDLRTQEAAAQALEEVETGAVVALDAGSGAVRAAVSRPGDGFPRALTGQYPPGSTFKVVTAAALLSAGASPDDALECPAEIDSGGRSFRNAGHDELGTVSLQESFAASCNTAFIGAAAELPASALAEAAEQFGFGDGDDASYEVAGRSIAASFPEPGDDAEAAAAAIGQGRVAASPLQMASVAATATSGVRHRPHLLVEEAGGDEDALPEEITSSLREMMREVVTSGTGTVADVGGAVGKTGTAEHDGGEHAWFIGESAGLAFAVLVEDGGAGGETAAPVAAAFLEALGN